MIQIYEKYHGIAVLRLIHGGKTHSIELISNTNSSYLIDEHIGIFVKYSTKRLSPWTFSFDANHSEEILALNDLVHKFFLVLVCGFDGICCLDWSECSQVISFKDNSTSMWIRAGRRVNEKYRVNGSAGKLTHKIADLEFPKKVSL